MRFSILPVFLLSLATSVLAAPSSINTSGDLSARSSGEDVDKRTFSHFCQGNTKWAITKCCPKDAYEWNFRCQCNDKTKTLSWDGQRCESKCSQTDWKWCNTQCCPPGSDEVNGQCKCSGGKQLVGSGNNKRCVDQCTTGRFCDTRCCPHGSSEKRGQCVCDSSNQQLSKDGKKCEDKCTSPFTYSNGQCCPPGSTSVNGQCKCTDSKKQIVGSGNNQKCDYSCPSGCGFKDTKCCPHDSFELHGKCQCNDSSKTLSADGLRCESLCTKSGEVYSNGICCKSHLTNKNGKCECPTTGQIDNGSSCSACPNGKNYNWIQHSCDPSCPSGTSYKMTRRGQGVCCRSGAKACETVCCPQDQEEVGHSGKCCKPGSTLDSKGQCLEPSHVPTKNYKRRSSTPPAPRAAAGLVPQQIQLTASALSVYFGLDENVDGKLCPKELAACPIDGVASGSSDYECLDIRSDLQSCGGCASMGEGKDCTLIPGAKWMGCVQGECEVYSCSKGFKLVNGACAKA